MKPNRPITPPLTLTLPHKYMGGGDQMLFLFGFGFVFLHEMLLYLGRNGFVVAQFHYEASLAARDAF